MNGHLQILKMMYIWPVRKWQSFNIRVKKGAGKQGDGV